MAQIDFYLIEQQNYILIACKLLEKIYKQELTAHVHCASEDIAKRVNETLWTFKDASFIPHELISEIKDHEPPISIGFGDQMPPAIYDILVNISPELPEFGTQFERILNIVPKHDNNWKQMARDYYKDFKEQGWQVNHHNL